ncbi:peptide chain release factor-like protein [Phragmitibacter flavus]|uniref:Peptide chain release factor-like protein n=1 Tax=Phragmitibacter flavus TaxID=2576071 RepID=A0A5R8K968_9BACT|nr:peptide chain release factor-like protein [Phragmitibacter flavus]TLD68853.1 peptide chain release factor-like protein [Phragmitibacter flavus]
MAAAPDDDALQARMTKLGVREEDLEESFVRGTGAGGQKINKTSSTVVLRHVVSGVEVRCQQQRSQSMNRLIARRELCDKLEQQREEARLAKRAVVEKKRRANRPRPRGVKERILKGKHIRSEVKRGRSSRGRDE